MTDTGQLAKGPKVTSHGGAVTRTNETLRQCAIEVEELFSLYGRRLHPASGIGRTLQAAKDIPDARTEGRLTNELIERAAYADTICNVILEMRDEPEIARHLERLRSGGMDHLERGASNAKNAFWELEVLQVPRAAGLNARHDERPDVVAEVLGVEVGFACKVIYSEQALLRSLSRAAEQIDATRTHGVVAISLSELQEPGHVPHVADNQKLGEYLGGFNREIVENHLEDIKDYIDDERILGVMVGLRTPACVKRRATMAQQYYFHIVHGDNPERYRIAKTLNEAINSINVGDP